jgi:hypothetical protein
LSGYSDATPEELDATNSYRKVPVEWRDAFQRPIRINYKLSFLNSMPLHLGVADIEGYSSEGVVLGYPDFIDTLQPLCNGPIAGAYFPPEQLRAVLRRIRLTARSKLHECVPRPVHTEIKETKQSVRAGFIDSLIIVCVSVALVIFLFWIATQTLRLDTFLTIPSFIQDSFKAIWTSVAAGATGVGLAVYKALTRSRNEPTPNYLLLIAITTCSMIVLIFLLLYVLTSVGPSSTSRDSNSPNNARPTSVRVAVQDSANTNASQTTYLHGVVRDLVTKQGIAGAVIEVELLPGKTFITASDGGFSITEIPAAIGDNARVYVRKEDYGPRDEYVVLPGPKTFYLEKPK